MEQENGKAVCRDGRDYAEDNDSRSPWIEVFLWDAEIQGNP